jgi:alkanesulfonate monooxygenase SsuD/methylene tetrahydromethanopterin reductase-like flavin-dependent oxidoreductase (luciferase family)
MRIGISAMPSTPAAIDLVVEAERMGVDSVWTPEFWAYDAITPLAHLSARTSTIRLGTAIVQLGARTPAMLAMTAMSMQALSGGRFVLGLGTSGPQVMEGWHGVEFTKPIRRTRETIEIVRMIARHDRLEYDGEIYRLPLPGGEGRSEARWIGISTGELADGWIGNSFLPESADVFLDPIRRGAEAAGRSLADVELTVAVGLEITDDVEEASRRHARGYAFTFGAMGSARSNFYKDAFARQGFGEAVEEVQRLWLAGDRDAAADRVPLEIGFRTNLIGPRDVIAERVRLYRDVGISTLRVGLVGEDRQTQLDALGTLLDIVNSL